MPPVLERAEWGQEGHTRPLNMADGDLCQPLTFGNTTWQILTSLPFQNILPFGSLPLYFPVIIIFVIHFQMLLGLGALSKDSLFLVSGSPYNTVSMSVTSGKYISVYISLLNIPIQHSELKFPSPKDALNPAHNPTSIVNSPSHSQEESTPDIQPYIRLLLRPGTASSSLSLTREHPALQADLFTTRWILQYEPQLSVPPPSAFTLTYFQEFRPKGIIFNYDIHPKVF